MHTDLLIVFGNLYTAVVDRFSYIARRTLTAAATFVVTQVVLEGQILLASKVPN